MSHDQSRKMIWAEVREAYPDEWVALVDLDMAPDEVTVVGGRVVDHDESRKSVFARTKPARPATMTIRYTGRVGVGSFLL